MVMVDLNRFRKTRQGARGKVYGRVKTEVDLNDLLIVILVRHRLAFLHVT